VDARIGFSQALVCDSTIVEFSDSSIVVNDMPSAFQWSFGDGSSSSDANPGHFYNEPGSYLVKLVVTSQAGCIDSTTMSQPITVVRSPRIGIGSTPSVCIYDTLNFTGNLINPDSSAVQWHWNFGNGGVSSRQNPSQAFNTAGNFGVTGTATRNGCSDTATAVILVHPLPNLQAGTDTMICRGQIFTLQPTGAASYMWQPDASLECTTCLTPTVNPVSDTRYYVTGTSAAGCRATDSVLVRVQQPFSLRVSNSDSLCAGKSLQLVANGATKYSWFPSAGLSNINVSNPVATPGQTTQYRVIGSDDKNCFSDTGFVNVTVFAMPEFRFNQPVITLPAGSTSVISTAASADITRWKWSPAIGLSCADCPQPVVTAKDNIAYNVEASNDGGCSTSARVTVQVICNDGNVFIPNTFSPNHDGMNDVFYLRGKGVNSVKSMKVFNRWGELVFEKTNFNANDPGAGWNGTYKNSILTPDVYVFLVDVVCDNNAVFTLKGNVSLIR
jgi:gliding motility-associated-like protein